MTQYHNVTLNSKMQLDADGWSVEAFSHVEAANGEETYLALNGAPVHVVGALVPVKGAVGPNVKAAIEACPLCSATAVFEELDE